MKTTKLSYVYYGAIFLLSFVAFYGFTSYQKDHETKFIVTSVKHLSFNQRVLSLKLVGDTTVTFAAIKQQSKPSYKIILTVDGSCSTCFETLTKWNELFIKEHLSYDKLLIFGYDNTLTQLRYVKSQLPQLKAPIFFDPEYRFGTLNGIDQNGINKFLLVDKDFNVVTASNPFIDQSVMNTYLHFIKL